MRYKTRSGVIFDTVNYVFMALFSFATIYPFIYVLANSLSDPYMVEAQRVFFWPVKFTLDAYSQIAADRYIYLGFLNSTYYTVGSTVLDVIATFMVAYPLSKKNLALKGFFFGVFFVKEFLSAGLIPNYLLMDALGLVDNRLVMIIPGLIKLYHLVLVRNYLWTIPDSLEESALIDGANQMTILWKIMIPLSLPILATIALFRGVDEWNKFMDAIIYFKSQEKYPLTVWVWRLMIVAQVDADDPTGEKRLSIASLKYATSIITIVPILMIYPFLQKYFVKGILIGSVKG